MEEIRMDEKDKTIVQGDDKKKKYYPPPAVKLVAIDLIQKYHSVLVNANFNYTFRTGTWNKNGKPCYGEIKKLSPYIAQLSNIDFGMVINAEQWFNMKKHQQSALIDHLLSFCSCDEDKDGNPKWIKVNPPVSEFPSVAERHGAYDESLQMMQQSLDNYREENKNK